MLFSASTYPARPDADFIHLNFIGDKGLAVLQCCLGYFSLLFLPFLITNVVFIVFSITPKSTATVLLCYPGIFR